MNRSRVADNMTFELLVQHKFEFHACFPYDNFSVYTYLEKNNKMK